MTETCETCRFWRGKVSGRVYTMGPCVRFPPDGNNLRPRMPPQDWCGEYRRTDA